MRHSVKLINKKTWNMSSAPKIATAKCVHWSYSLSKRGYKLPRCSCWIQNTFPSLVRFVSFFLFFYELFGAWYHLSAYPFIIMLFELLSLQQGSIKAFLLTGSCRAHIACRAAPVNSISTEVRDLHIQTYSNDTGLVRATLTDYTVPCKYLQRWR